MGPEANSDNVQHVGSLPGEAAAMDAGGRLVGHYFYVTGMTHFSIYDVADPLHPKLTARVDFPCRFENEDVAVNGDILMWSDFATTGDLYVYDVRDKANPKLVADMPGLGTHTMECLEGCRYGFGSYHAVSSAGPLLTGEDVEPVGVVAHLVAEPYAVVVPHSKWQLVTGLPFCGDRKPVPWMSWMASGPGVPPPPPPAVGAPGAGAAAVKSVPP